MTKMRPGHPLFWYGVILLVFVGGAGCGLLFQRNIGLGTLLRTIGVGGGGPPPPTRTPVGIPPEFQGQLSLFVLVGQSNMSGYGELPAEQQLHPRAFMFGNDYYWRLAAEPIDSPLGQVDRVSMDGGERIPGMGPGLAFATTLLAQQPELVVGLIPCAKGNTAIEQWQRNLSDESLYGACLKQVGAAATMGQVAGILVFQGEADALDPERFPDRQLAAHNYGERFSQFVTDLRTDFSNPNLPLVYAQIGSHTAPVDFVNWSVVQAQQAAVALPCTAMITTDDLPLMDAVHYTTDSYRIIGQRFAAAYIDLLASEACP